LQLRASPHNLSDVNYQSANDTPAPPAPSDAPDVLTKHIDSPIEGGSDEERVRACVAALNEKRQREWKQGVRRFGQRCLIRLQEFGAGRPGRGARLVKPECLK
jgi:hypothetical protein